MTQSHRLAALLVALTFAGCDAPVDADESPINDPAGLTDDAVARVPMMFGQVSGEHGIDRVETSVCLHESDLCADLGHNGAFALPGIGDGYSDALVVRAPGYRPLVVPVQASAGNLRFGILELEPERKARSGAGSVRFRTYRLNARMAMLDAEGVWTVEGAHDASIETDGEAQQVDGLAPGTYEARYSVKEAPNCFATSGWDGADNRSVAFPVLAGTTTHVEHYCLDLRG